MQYAVTVDVLHTVFSAFGTVQKIAIFEKNGGTQALIQYPDVTTAAVAKEALEGHCIYDGGYCKLHLSYSRHTDLNVKAHNERGRDYTIPEAGILPLQQAPGVAAHAPGWQAPATPMYPGAQAQMPAWDPTNMQAAGRPPYSGVPNTGFPPQPYAAPHATVPPHYHQYPPGGPHPISPAEHLHGSQTVLPPPPPYGRPTAPVVSQPPVYYS
uniref:Polypyrimidine tract-binding 1 n=1 Tax=Anthurium amnicola TaxID=1678845 RepID=A0A1D1YSI9_9ARAE